MEISLSVFSVLRTVILFSLRIPGKNGIMGRKPTCGNTPNEKEQMQ